MKPDQIAKAFLKIGAKALAPFGGDVLLTAVQEFGGLAIDEAASAKAKKVSKRILDGLETGFEDFARSEGISDEHVEALFERARAILEKNAIIAQDWIGGSFNPDRVTTLYIDRTAEAWDDNATDERELVQRIIHDFIRLMIRERSTLEALDAEFRSAILDGLDRVAHTARSAVSEERAELAAIAAAALIAIPSRRWRPGLSPPGALLRADIDAPVPFHGREQELGDLLAWCERPDAVLVRLFTGAGGMGKSRLLIESCQKMSHAGWRAGFLDRRVSGADPSAFRLLLEQDRLLVVVDYAETRRPEARSLIRAAFEAGGDKRTRIVLLARSAEDWWDTLRGEGDGVGDILSGPATDRIALRPLAPSMEERRRSYHLARDHFSAQLQQIAAAAEPDDLDGACYRAALLLHMRALAEVEGVQVKGEQGILDYVLDRERRYWSDRAMAAGLDDVLKSGISQAMAAVTLGGGIAAESDALVLLRKIRLLADQPAAVLGAIANVLHETYPGDCWIEPVLPDLLGEHLVESELASGAEDLMNIVFDEPDP